MAEGMSQSNGGALGKCNQDQRVTLKGKGIEIRRTGKPVESTVLQSGAVYLVIDCSGSMAGDKVREALGCGPRQARCPGVKYQEVV